MKKRNNKFYKNEPNVAEIEHRLKNVLAYIDEGKNEKAKGGIKGVWHTLMQITEKLQDAMSDIDFQLDILKDNITRYTNEQFMDENETQTAIDSVLESVSEIRPYLETTARYIRKQKYSDDALKKAWSLMFEQLREKAVKDFDWRARGYSDKEIERLLRDWFVWLNGTPPKGTKIKYDHDRNILYIPIYSREHRDEFAAYLSDIRDFFTNHFKEKFEVDEDFKY